MNEAKKTEKKVLDQYEQALEVEINILQMCQKERNLKSCMECDKLIGCEIRKKYVQAVYTSMNKDSGGGFEF